MQSAPVRLAAPKRLSRATAGLLLVAGLLGSAWASAADKTDVIVFLNGDRLTGEVKGLERGKLSFKTDATGTIAVEWDKVASLRTNQYMEVERTDGRRHFGRASDEQTDGTLRLRVGSGSKSQREVPLAEVVRLAPIEQGRLIDRLDGYVTAGFDYTKATDLQQFTFTGGLSSRNEKRQWSIDGSTTQVSQDGRDDTSRFELSAVSRRLLPERWFLQGFGGLEGNDELGLDLRTTLGAAYGRFLRQDQTQDWAAYAGLALTEENFSEQPNNESVEAVLGTQYWFYRYDSPEASFNASLNLYPSLTESGRVRSEGRLRARYEIVSDLFFEASLYGSYDNEPGAGAQSKSDYGVTTSLGYSF